MQFWALFAISLAFLCQVWAQTAGFDAMLKPTNWQDVPAGQTFQIVWQPAAYTGTITLELLGGATPATLWVLGNIATGIDNQQGHYDWAVPASLGDLETYGIRILLESNPSTLQYSFPFHIEQVALPEPASSAPSTVQATTPSSAAQQATTAQPTASMTQSSALAATSKLGLVDSIGSGIFDGAVPDADDDQCVVFPDGNVEVAQTATSTISSSSPSSPSSSSSAASSQALSQISSKSTTVTTMAAPSSPSSSQATSQTTAKSSLSSGTTSTTAQPTTMTTIPLSTTSSSSSTTTTSSTATSSVLPTTSAVKLSTGLPARCKVRRRWAPQDFGYTPYH